MRTGKHLQGSTTQPPPVTAVRGTSMAVAALTAAALPVFLTGALQGRIADDLDIGTGAIGTAIAAFFIAGAVTSIPGGRLVDRLGAPMALRLGMLVAAVAAVGVALGADDRWRLTAGLALAGTALALVDPGGARALAASVPRRKLGIAFGAKEASIPLASLLAGLVLPVLGAQLGWRPAFYLGAGLAVLTAMFVPSALDPMPARRSPASPASPPADRWSDRQIVEAEEPSEQTSSEPGASADPPGSGEGRSVDPTTSESAERLGTAPRTGPLLAGLAVSAALAGAVAAAVASFLVPTAQVVGTSAAAAGILLSVASMASVATRLASGLLVDRRPGSELRVIAAMTAVGALGVGVLAILSGPGEGSAAVGGASGMLTLVALVVAGVAALGAGWGWTGLIFLSAVRLEPERPARAAGAVLAGLGVGGSFGPAVLGTVAEQAGFTLAWTIGAVAMGIGAIGTSQLRRWMPQR